MSNDLGQVALTIVLCLGGLAALLTVMAVIEPKKGSHRAPRENAVRVRRDG